METKQFTLLELLQARTWLSAVMSSTSSFTHVKVSQEQIQGARKRLREIDQELVGRLMEWKAPEAQHRVFEDDSFEETLQYLKETREEEEKEGE